MAEALAQRPGSAGRTIYLPIAEDLYGQIVEDAPRFRAWLDQSFQQAPELFPEAFARGYAMKDRRLFRF